MSKTENEIDRILAQYGLRRIGGLTIPETGKISTNLIVETQIGKVVLRTFTQSPSMEILGYDKTRFNFEVEVLDYLSAKSSRFPQILRLLNGELEFSGDTHGFAYRYLPGQTLLQAALTPHVAAQAGHLLYELMQAAQNFTPKSLAVDGDQEYILRILNKTTRIRSDFPLSLAQQFREFLNRPSLLQGTPKGLVHGDYFFENTLFEGGKAVGVIDFGDAYFGWLLSDLATGLMEFSVLDDERWRGTHFEAFLTPFAPFIREYNITFKQLEYTILMNCIRFAAHTINLDQTVSLPVKENGYIKRFERFQSDVSKDLEPIFDRVVAQEERRNVK